MRANPYLAARGGATVLGRTGWEGRRILHKLGLAALLTTLVVRFSGAAAAESVAPNASTVIGANVFLSDGAAALNSGDFERGVELTRMGLAGALSQSDRAAAYSNLCAGYAALKRYERALENCDLALELSEANWRTWQNRAAAHLGLGKVEESLKDIERGLQINPQAAELHKTLAIARGYEALRREKLQELLES